MITVSEFYNELEKLHQTGDLVACEKYILKEIGLNKMCCGNISPIDIAGNNELGRIYLEQGKTEDALIHYQEACNLTKRQMGEDSLEYASALRNLADTKHKNGDVKEAYKLIKKAVEILEKIGGKETAFYSFTLSDAAMIAASDGEMDNACRYLSLAAEAAEKAGMRADSKALVNGNLGMCLLKAGNTEAAKAALTKATAYADEIPNGRDRLAPLYKALASLQ